MSFKTRQLSRKHVRGSALALAIVIHIIILASYLLQCHYNTPDNSDVTPRVPSRTSAVMSVSGQQRGSVSLNGSHLRCKCTA